MRDHDLFSMFHELCVFAQIDSDLRIVPSPASNAWTDGRTVFITRGLIEALSPEEIGGILGHELAHIACGHVPEERSALEALLVAFRRRPADSLVTTVISEAITATVLLALQRLRSRENEFEADRVGQAYASRVGLGDDSLANGLSKIAEGHRQTSLWDTHPDIASRRAALEDRPCRRLRIRIRRSR